MSGLIAMLIIGLIAGWLAGQLTKVPVSDWSVTW